MNTVKRWLAGFLSFAMIFTSAAFSNVGALAVYAAGETDMNAKITITSAAGSEHVYDNITNYDTFVEDMQAAKAGDTVKVEGPVYVETNYDTNDAWVYTPSNLTSNNGVITVDASGATFTGIVNSTATPASYKSLGIAAGTGYNANQTATGVYSFAKVFYSRDNVVVDFPKEYDKSKRNDNYGAQVSFTLANGATVPGNVVTTLTNPGDVTLQVTEDTANNVEPTCTTDGRIALKAAVTGKPSSTTENNFSISVTKDYGEIKAKGHKYGDEKDGVITLPAYRANSNFNYNNANEWNFGIQINWAVRGSGANINASQDADGNTIIESIKTRCINVSHDYDANAQNTVEKQWADAQVTSISKKAGSAASAKNAGSSIYTIGVKTAEGIDITVKQTVYDVPGLGATNIGKIHSVGFETMNYIYNGATKTFDVDTTVGTNGTTYDSTLYGTYTDGTGSTAKVNGTKYKKTVIADNGDVKWQVKYYDAETGDTGLTKDQGTATGTLSPSKSGDKTTSKIYSCGHNTYYYGPIALKVVKCDTTTWKATGSVWDTQMVYLDATENPANSKSGITVATGFDNETLYTDYPQSGATYFKAEVLGTHTLDMNNGNVTYKVKPTTYSAGKAEITCKICGGPNIEVEVPMLTEGALYELKDHSIIDEESLSSKAKEATTELKPTCEDDGYSYYWSVDTGKFLTADNNNVLIPATISSVSDIKAGNSQFLAIRDNNNITGYVYINSNSVGDAKQAYTDANGQYDVIYVVDSNAISDNNSTVDTTHKFAGGMVKIAGSEVEKLGHDWYVASTSDVHWSAINQNTPDASVFVTIDYTCKNESKNKAGYTAHRSIYTSSTGANSPKKAITYNFARGTDSETVKYSAITKSIEPGEDCTVHSSIVYTVKDVKDVFGNEIKISKEDTNACGNHKFKDQLNWSDDGKSATVTRTCENEECLGSGNSNNGGYNAHPLVAACTVTKEDQDDGSYLYTATYAGEELGTKRVIDLRDAKAVVNDGSPVDENLYPGKDSNGNEVTFFNNNGGVVTDVTTGTAVESDMTDARRLPSYTITINGHEIDPDLYNYVTTTTRGSYVEEPNKVASFQITSADDTDAYGTFTVKYKILKNKEFDLTTGNGAYKVDNGDAVAFPNNTRSSQVLYDGKKHSMAVTSVKDTNTTPNEVIKKTTVKYAILTNQEVKNITGRNNWTITTYPFLSRKQAEALNYVDTAEFTEIGDYNVFGQFSADGFTTGYGFIGTVSIVKQYKKRVNVFIDNATVIEGSTPNLHLRVVGLDGAENGKEISFDPADFTVTTVGGETLENLKVGSYQLIATSEVYDIQWANNQVNGYMGTLEVLPKDNSTKEEQAAAESVTALINALNENSTEAEVKAARDAYDKLSDVAKKRVDSSVLKKLTDAEDKIATDKVIDQLNKATTDADKAAAYEAYSKLSDAQKAAVEAAVGKDKVDAAKAAKDAADKKAADEAAAKKAAEELATAKTAANNSIAAAKGYESNAAVKSAIDALNAAVAKNDTAAIKTATTALNNAVAAAKKEATSGPKKGKTYTVGGQKYLATSTTAVSMQKAKNAKTVTVPATVMINGKKANVTGIKKGAFGKKTKTVNIKSKKLTKKGVKNSLKGSKVKTVKVRCGKKFVKKYKKYFTKKNAGKKVTVK